MVITNSYILYKHHRLGTVQTQTIPFKQFRLTLADLLVGDYCSCKRPGRPYTVRKQPAPLLHVPIKRMDAIDKEALAIIFYQCIYGRKFLLHSDHKPLEQIFGAKGSIQKRPQTNCNAGP